MKEKLVATYFRYYRVPNLKKKKMQTCLNTYIYNVQIQICTNIMYNVLITFNTTACRILDSKLSSSPPPMALIALSFVEFPAGISLSKLTFYGQQLMRGIQNTDNRRHFSMFL